MLRSTAALESILQFEKHFTLKYCGYGKRYYFLSPKIGIWETLLSLAFLGLCIPIGDYSSCVAYLLRPPFEMKFSQVGFIASTLR